MLEIYCESQLSLLYTHSFIFDQCYVMSVVRRCVVKIVVAIGYQSLFKFVVRRVGLQWKFSSLLTPPPSLLLLFFSWPTRGSVQRLSQSGWLSVNLKGSFIQNKIVIIYTFTRTLFSGVQKVALETILQTGIQGHHSLLLLRAGADLTKRGRQPLMAPGNLGAPNKYLEV